MLRRGYNFVDGCNSLGGLDAGLFFIAFVRDPDTHFIPIQNKMAVPGRADGVPQGHRLRAVRRTRPASAEGEYVGQALFA